MMDKKLIIDSISYCGLICKLCHLAEECDGCQSSANRCENHSGKWGGCFHRKCCIQQGIKGCWECKDFPCDNDMYSPTHDLRIRAFARCIKEDGIEKLAEYIIENEKQGIRYGYQKDYDFKQNEDMVLKLLRTGKSE